MTSMVFKHVIETVMPFIKCPRKVWIQLPQDFLNINVYNTKVV